ncbi:hypothetical protein [Staphylococcus agnetis]|uniref:hypothetical protein n=1 Tax=Staphylococcus agnetis TaxID=985762 RepID=UPI0004E2CF1D|nr:hypothetical protein [Staphylococcus agnetis]KFE41831.1 hypothetical protein SAGN_05395 [Staphylococcus agnetis]NJH65918.1 hypothetical protein [Staphylococcus agnetis]NJH98260.1 hypothetical protein [Staphylococcus agnetis]PTH49105.1 hypothetical protein BU587_01550 [Staphylococcus agnetis]PTH73648.1 hypothetical protein BU581_03730 [Staphylococcus agnetis]
MNVQEETYSPEQLEAMQKPKRRQAHTFINEALKSIQSFQPHHLQKGISYILFLDKCDIQFLQPIVDQFEQVIVVFETQDALAEFVRSPLKDEQHVFYYFDDRAFQYSFKFVTQRINQSHCCFYFKNDARIETRIKTEQLAQSVVYGAGSQKIYPTYMIKKLNLHYRLHQYMRHYIDEVVNHTYHVSYAIKGHYNEVQKVPKIQSSNDVIQALETIKAIYNETMMIHSNVMQKPEANILIEGIRHHLDQQDKATRDKLYAYIYQSMDQFNYHLLNKDKAETLVIAYCFPPYIDTSGNVMAKRIRDKNEIVDVISNNMARLRQTDEKLTSLSHHLIDRHYQLEAKQAFSSWESISGFVEQGLEVLQQNSKTYQHLYSRAMFPQSHFLAYEIKQKYPDIFWRAEFSDPLHSTVTSDLRFAPIEDTQYIETIKSQLKPELKALVDDNVFNVCELLALSDANELIFTNENQLEYMIARFDDTLKHSIRQRAVISRHPIPLKSDYRKEMTHYTVDPDVINLGYFGNFYETRGFNEIELVCKYLEAKGETNFKIHCFTNVKGNVKALHRNSDFNDYIVLHSLVGYFEFLNITTLLDGLLLFDAHTKGIKSINPYIPSKLSDYKGSGKAIWAFTEEKSIMDQDEDIIRTHLEDFEHYIDGFNRIKNNVARFNSEK